MTDENTTPADTEGNASGGKKTQNNIELRGNLAGDITFTDMGEGRRAARFSVATAESYKDRESGEWKNRAAEFTTVNVTNQAQVKDLEAAAEKGLGKGKQIAIEGSIRHRTFEKAGGEKGYATEVVPRNGQTAVKTEFAERDYRQVNRANIRGYVADEPVVGETKSGGKFLNMTLATDYGVKQEDGSFKSVTTYHRMTSYSPKQIEAAEKAIASGDLGTGALVEVMGRQQTRVAETNGEKKYFPEIAMRGGDDGLKIIEASKAKRQEKAAEETAKPKGKGKGKKKDDPEIPF